MRFRVTFCFLSLFALATGTARADEVTDWNRIMLDALLVPPAVAPAFTPRTAAIVHAAIFDAVNGIEQRYTPIHVVAAAPRGASQRAAAVQAAYASLVHLFPSQIGTFDQKRTDSLIGIASGAAAENSESIRRGIEWGQTVADEIWTWRSTDGFSNVLPPFLGGLAPGQWRPSRTADQTLYARFWASATPTGFWDPVATSLGAERHLNLSENARLLALVNIALADAVIGCWDAKYTYVSWRPVTAIPLADTDGNPGTISDPNWTPLLPTPSHPEYPSAHSCISSAGVRIMSNYFGENTQISVVSDQMPGVTRFFPSFSGVLDEVGNARVFGGMHFRTAVNDGRTLGTAVGDYVLSHALLPVHGQREGQLHH
jgi:PAP2 superfamily protein